MPFDLDNARMFLAAVERGSFSAAARALHRVPSAVSMAMSNLEAELDLQLFDRTGREPRPTDAALALLPQARLVVEQVQKLNMHALTLTRGLETSLTIAVAPELLAVAAWTETLTVVADEFPLLQIEVLTAPQADALAIAKSGRAHLALVFERYGVTAHEQFVEVAEETLVAVVAPTHAMLSSSTAGGLTDEQLQTQRQVVVAGRDSDQLDKRVAISSLLWRTDNPTAALNLVVAGLGWAWLPSGLVRDAIAQGKLVMIPLENFTNVLRLFVDVVWTSERTLGLAARRFVSLLQARRKA